MPFSSTATRTRQPKQCRAHPYPVLAAVGGAPRTGKGAACAVQQLSFNRQATEPGAVTAAQNDCLYSASETIGKAEHCRRCPARACTVSQEDTGGAVKVPPSE